MKIFVLALTVLIMVMSGCSATTEGTISKVDVQEFAQLISNNDVFVIDTHIPEQEHITGTNAFIPYNALKESLELLPPDKNTPIAVYCRSGSMSAEAAATLHDMGYKTVYDLEGGANAWRAERLEFGGIHQQTEKKVTIFKSASCGCCVGYVGELQKQGFEVNVINSPNMEIVKQRYGIPRNMESCHTLVIGDYFVEGHVPIEAVDKLLEEQPDIDGITLPDMPSGSPGMPGPKRAPFMIYSLKEGEILEFTTI